MLQQISSHQTGKRNLIRLKDFEKYIKRESVKIFFEKVEHVINVS